MKKIILISFLLLAGCEKKHSDLIHAPQYEGKVKKVGYLLSSGFLSGSLLTVIETDSLTCIYHPGLDFRIGQDAWLYADIDGEHWIKIDTIYIHTNITGK